MNEETKARSRALWNEHAKEHEGDLFAQVRRTINGRPVDDEQIALIVDAVVDALDLRAEDLLLDLCCGNGFLSDRFFARCRGGVGVDFSDVLIATANEHFARAPERQFVCADVVRFVADEADPERFTKAVSYGSFQYLSDEDVSEALAGVRARFTSVRRFMIGNHVDREKLQAFFDERRYAPGIENETVSALGRWRTEAEIRRIAEATGWRAMFRRMPPQFYGAHYRFDVVLEPV